MTIADSKNFCNLRRIKFDRIPISTKELEHICSSLTLPRNFCINDIFKHLEDKKSITDSVLEKLGQ